MKNQCIKCGSYAFNLLKDGIDQGGLCDVHYWEGRAHRAEALAQPALNMAYSIDDDPIGIRKRAADAIIGTLALGAQDSSPPPAGHWLQQFWDLGRAEASKATPPAAQPAHEPTSHLLALDAAVSALYFDDGSDFRSALGAVIRHLDPKLAGEMLTHPKAVYDQVKARLATPSEQPAHELPEKQPPKQKTMLIEDVAASAYPLMQGAGISIGLTHGVQLTHKPTGLTVACASEKSPEKNYDKAWAELEALVLKKEGV